MNEYYKTQQKKPKSFTVLKVIFVIAIVVFMIFVIYSLFGDNAAYNKSRDLVEENTNLKIEINELKDQIKKYESSPTPSEPAINTDDVPKDVKSEFDNE